jgi:hypothetical protein
MITIAILILIVAKALPGLNTRISSIHVTRITSIVFLFSGALSLNSLNLDCIGSGIGIYGGFFQVTPISQLIEIFLFVIGGGILIAWPQIKYNLYSLSSFLPVYLWGLSIMQKDLTPNTIPFYYYSNFYSNSNSNKFDYFYLSKITLCKVSSFRSSAGWRITKKTPKFFF